MPDDPTPRRERVVLSARALTDPELRAIERYAQLPWWRRLTTRAPRTRRTGTST